MDYLKVLRVAVRILMDVIAVFDKKETDFEIGCKCKDIETAKALQKMLGIALEDCPVQVILKEEMIVVVLPESTQPFPSLPLMQHLPAPIQ